MTDDDNPFSPDRLAALEFRLPPGLTWPVLLERCAAAEYCCAIVGPAGSGKSTLLTQLAPHLVARGFNPRLFLLNAESRRAERDAVLAEARAMRAPDLLLLDGAEQLQTREWLALRLAINGLAGCIITLHRTGRLPTVLETGTTPALLDEIATDLTGGRLPVGEASVIHTRNHGNLRACLAELRSRWAGAE
ncbi:MAG: hypothetical protein K8R23_14890 [Chthoniobacter sp.]|nr:hypothetical protein [Chthoniobacter sp.]